MRKKFLLILIAFVAATITTTTLAFLLTNITVPTTGIIKEENIGVYWDSECSNPVTEINWDVIEPGSTKNTTVYMKNEANTSLTLSKSMDNWNPETAANYILLSWNYAGEINPGQIVQVTLTLSISSSIQGITNFSFDIIITGSD